MVQWMHKQTKEGKRMSFEICVCDLDGTLLGSNGRIAEADADALKHLMQKGVDVILATGRTDLMIREYVEQLNIKRPVIACNGALVRDQRSGEILYSQLIPTKVVEEILLFSAQNDWQTLVYTPDTVFYSPSNVRASHFARYNENAKQGHRVPLVPDAVYRENPSNHPVMKVLVHNASANAQTLLEEQFNRQSTLQIVSSAKGLIDIMAYGCTKGAALTFLANREGLNLQKAVVFGDNYNDTSMFAVCGLSVAMGNAEQEVIQAADKVTLTNDECGVSYALETFCIFDDLKV